MSGIVGIYFFDSHPVDKTDIEEMLKRIAHRGTDGSGIWTDGPIGFGHRMLRTTPESLNEKLPISNATGDLIITADARIDNRDELIGTFDLNGRSRQTITDSEIILTAVEKWGEGCPERLLGDFSFAVWDRRKGRLFCARDHMGIKPFYYYLSDKLFVFASEIKALLCIKEIPCRVNEKRVAEYLLFLDEEKTDTFYKGILRLAPGSCMQIARGRVSSKTYWSLNPSKELRLSSDVEYTEAFHDLFSKSVQCRLRSASSIGSMLSGGLDSSSIVCTARQLLAQNGKGNLHTFSGIFDRVKECDESHYIEAVLSQGDLIPHFYHTDRMSPLSNLTKMLHHEEEPFYTPHLYMYWGLYEIAKGLNVHIVLDGTDGDTTLAHSLIYLTELTRQRQWATLYKEIKGLSEKSKRPFWKYLWPHSIKAFAPEFIRNAWRNLHKRKNAEIDWEILNPSFLKNGNISLHLKAMLNKGIGPLQNSRLVHHSLLTSGMVSRVLEIINKAAGAFSIEPRFPFFDKRLVEFCLALPANQKLYRGWTRIIMRRAMTNILPEIIQWRIGKNDFYPNFRQGLLDYARESLQEIIGNESKIIENYINKTALKERFGNFLCQGRIEDADTIWKSVVLAKWFYCTSVSF